jgi:intracellular sulfur oxidation DsrE/DsrF family protein
MRKIVLILVLLFGSLVADTEFADPPPSLENPRKFVFPITKGQNDEINHVLNSANNVMKFYGPEKCEVCIVAYSKGLNAVMKRRLFAKRVRSLMTYDVEFIACGNTMRTFKVKEKDLIDGVEVVTAGIVELIERQLRGWIYIRP